MIIKALVENTSVSNGYGSEHGLSLYIESKGRKILFDVGASNLFYENAKKMNVNISDIQYLVISHGHYDHGSGLKLFLKENKKANVFIHNLAFEKYYALRQNNELKYIGLEEELKNNKQITFTYEQLSIDDGIQVFSNVAQNKPLPTSNAGLLKEDNGQMKDDTFAHEQNLIVEEEGKTLLITGCAHNGIINILEHFYKMKGHMPDVVVGGFHLSSRSAGDNESIENIDKIGRLLLDTKAKYYTCHCTGTEAYNYLKTIMGEKIDYLKTGMELTI